MKTLTKEQIEQILFDEENQPHQFGKLVWNGNELVFEAYPNFGVGGISPNMPDTFGEELARRYNNNIEQTPLSKATELQRMMHDIEVSYWEGSITYDEMLDKQIQLLLRYFKTSQ